MQNLRIKNVQIVNSSNVDVSFTEALTPDLTTSNISITSDTSNVPSSEVLSIKIVGNTLSITCQPLSPLAVYLLTFKSTPQHPFISINGDAKIFEDGTTNVFSIVGPLDPDNPVKNYLQSYYRDNIYNVEDDTSIVGQYIKSQSITLARALNDIRQLKNENYVSFTIVDEQKTRSEGPFDRLVEEGAYQILRVGKTPTGTGINANISVDVFPSFPITLQKQSAVEFLTADSVDELGKFNINSLTFNLNNQPITKITDIIFTFATANPIYTYDIATLGYQIKNSRYDRDFGFSYDLLLDNQIRISDKVLQDPNFSLDDIIRVEIHYEYKDLGIVVDSASISVYDIFTSTREVLPPIINIFSLKHSPIVDNSGNIATLGGITFLDPNSSVPGSKHPAFINEIPFRLNGLPTIPGQYAVDYATGTIYVYGQNLNNDGTGPFPPLATYNYKFTFKPDQDFVFDSDLIDLVALPLGNLINSEGTITFNYEKVLVPNVDYVANLHKEELSERVGNRLLALNTLRTLQSPITNVFRINNETSGELYIIDRWDNDKIYFRYNTPPKLITQIGERVAFNTIVNELLFVNTTFDNTNNLKIFKIFLKNNKIIGSTEDSLGTSFNTSVIFSDTNVFIHEKWFDREFSEITSFNKLKNVGEYTIDYENGIVYCAVSNTQGFNIGTVTYKNNDIVPQFPHIISVDDIYYQISSLNPKNKKFSYINFDDGSIIPDLLDNSDELFLNNTSGSPYQILQSQIGTFVDATFVPGVTNQVKFVRSIYEYQDLVNSIHPLNFAVASSRNDFNITVGSINKEAFDYVKFDGINYYVNTGENVPYISPNITYTFSVIRSSDSAQLWNGSGTIVPGDNLKLILPGINSPQINDLVDIVFTFSINDLSRVVIDYNRGDLFIDYVYLNDEIIISYEHGDNVLDFRTGKALSANDTYFVSYKVGALRDALLKNFGTLVNIPELSNFDVDFNRERYRDALLAALTSFIQGPTLSAIKNIGKTISHIQPEVIESAFQGWSLGSSLLSPEPITTTGEFQLLPGKFGNSVLVASDNQTIKFPTNSNIRFEEGTFETWISPQWNGLDNDANLTFSILRDGYAIDPYRIFLGKGETHPEITNNKFTINKNSEVSGKPNTNKDGIFIYYDLDPSGKFYRWYVDAIDGYVDGNASNYKITILTNGKFYDSKSLTTPKPSNMTTITGISNITMNLSGGSFFDEGLTFIADLEHYMLDFGEAETKNRLSLFKEASGYVNFRVYDKDKTQYSISADVSSWKINEFHHVAISWKLNTRSNRDEMHLFIDGLEVPNIIKYGQKLKPYLHEKFRTVTIEEIAGLANRDIVGSIDLSTQTGSNVVSSSINFSAFNIFAGDTIFIDEIGFSPSGYTINSVNGQELLLNSNMPTTINNGKFSINRTSFTVTSKIDVAPNTTVSTMHYVIMGSDLNTVTNSSEVSSASINFEAAGIKPGYLISINDPSLQIVYTILQVIGNMLIITDELPVTLTNATFRIYDAVEHEIPGVRAIKPDYSISKDINFNNILTISNDVFAGDLIVIRTLGLNHKRIKKQYYVWSDGVENILKTHLPPPISLDETKITKIILPPTAIGSSNSTLVAGVFQSNNLFVYQPSVSVGGRILSIIINGNNTDFSSPVQVMVDGISNSLPTTETLTFTDFSTQNTVNAFTSLNFIQINVKPIDPSKNALVISSKEALPITQSDGYTTPIIRFSYHIAGGYTLQKDSDNSVRDDNNIFSGFDINNYLWVHSPPTVAGFYKITDISADRKTLFVDPTNAATSLPLPDFNDGVYQILNVSAFRSGMQNGFFVLEELTSPGQPYFLNSGFYELEYFTYVSIKLDPVNSYSYIGSDFKGKNQINALIDQVKIYSIMLKDTRIGESIPANQKSITKDFNSLKPLKTDSTTLSLINFDTFPFINSQDFLGNTHIDKEHFNSSVVINENFDTSLVFLDKPLMVPNDGILDPKKSGTIEFWINPIFDTANDPNNRFYFDAFGAVVEEAVSANNVSVKLSSPASQILSVKLKFGDQSVDYFAGGKLEIDTQNAIQEEGLSINSNSVLVSKLILQVISVKIDGDPTETDYFANGVIGTDLKTIYLGKTLPQSNLPLIITYQTTENRKVKQNSQIIRLNRQLPYQNTHVVINYIPKGLQGDRLSIFKDTSGYINFSISASGSDFILRAPIVWSKNTWHRVKASYKVNSGIGTDEMHLFLDGYEWSEVQFGSGLVFGDVPFVMGSSMPGDGYGIIGNIRFTDPINNLFIGSQYNGTSPIFSLLDNFRISDIQRPIYAPYGESLDVNYSSNLENVFPVAEDLFTTFLLDFDSIINTETDFAVLQNRKTGLFDFSVNILDSLGIVNSSNKVREVLEKLIKVLKPANSKVNIQYII